MSKTKPRAIRWRDKVLNDTSLSDRAKFAAAVLVRFADDLNSHECHPSAEKCAEAIGKSAKTIKRGWADLKDAGYLIIEQRDSRRKPHAKIMLFPSNRVGTDGMDQPSGVRRVSQTEREQFVPALVTKAIDQDEVETQDPSDLASLGVEKASAPGPSTAFVPCASCEYPGCEFIGRCLKGEPND
jgi:hypothetical protein